MGMTAAEMLSRMSASEYLERKVYHQKINPFGEFRMDFRVGLVASRLMNLILALFAKDPKFTEISDFIIDFGTVGEKSVRKTEDVKIISPEKVKEYFMARMRFYPGSRVVDRRGNVLKVVS